MKKLLLVAALLFTSGISKADVIVATITGNGFEHFLSHSGRDSITVPESIGTLEIAVISTSGRERAVLWINEGIPEQQPMASGTIFPDGPSDYTYTPVGLAWIPFQSAEKTIKLTIVDDGRFEVDEYFELNFGVDLDGMPSFNSSYVLTVKIVDDDLEGDVNGDGQVSFTDMLILAANWFGGTTYEQGDLNGDGRVGFADFVILQENFGSSNEI